MIVAGTRLEPAGLAALDSRLRDAGMSECADRMEGASRDGSHLFAISTEERLGLIHALDDHCPDELQQLHASLKDALIAEAPKAAELPPGAPASGSTRGGTSTL